jgi:hypothetical protein
MYLGQIDHVTARDVTAGQLVRTINFYGHFRHACELRGGTGDLIQHGWASRLGTLATLGQMVRMFGERGWTRQAAMFLH